MSSNLAAPTHPNPSNSFEAVGPIFSSDPPIGPGCSTDVANPVGRAAEAGESLDGFGGGAIPNRSRSISVRR